MPITVIRTNKALSPAEVEIADKLCDSSNEIVGSELGVPDPEDHAKRVVRSLGKRTVAIVEFTVGPNEYPNCPGDHQFYPPDTKINAAGTKLAELIQTANLGIKQVQLSAWEDTTYMSSEQVPKSIPERPHAPDLLRYTHPLQLTVFASPEVAISPQLCQAVDDVSRQFRELIGADVNIAITQVDVADSGVSVELDCEKGHDMYLPSDVREYMAAFTLFSIKKQGVNTDFADVWVRQGEPKTSLFDVGMTPKNM